MTWTLPEKIKSLFSVSPPFQLLIAVAIPVTIIFVSALKLM